MAKIFLYLFPIKDYAALCVRNVQSDDSKLDESERYHRDEPFRVLNSTIDKRYRQKGYEIVYVVFPDTSIYGIEVQEGDRTIRTNVRYSDLLYEDISMSHIIKKLGDVDELVIGGYHYCSCVSQLADVATQEGIDTTIDGELTEYFFKIYDHPEFFDKDLYDPNRFKTFMKRSNF